MYWAALLCDLLSGILQLVDIDVGDTRYEHWDVSAAGALCWDGRGRTFKLVGLEYLDEVAGNDPAMSGRYPKHYPVDSLVEAMQESLDLILDRILHSVRDDQTDIFRLVLFRHRDLGTTFFELDYLLLSELIILDRKFLLGTSAIITYN